MGSQGGLNLKLVFIMARKTAVEIPGPEPLPKVGDVVEYIWPPDQSRPDIAGKALRSTVTAVYEGFDGRLLDLDVATGKGLLPVKSAPWRDAEDNAGNTWHWPLE